MFFKSPQFVKGVKIFGYGLASFFLYSLTNQLYLKYTKKNISNEDDESDEVYEIPYSYQYYDKESFNYYCDVKDISYLYLETVVRKYAINFNCKKLVVNIQKEIENATNKIKESEVKDKDVVKKDTGIFASFKSYNRKGTGGSKNPKKKYIVCEFANRYSYCGKVSEYKFLKKDDYKVEKPQEKMDYKTFKKLMDEKNKS